MSDKLWSSVKGAIIAGLGVVIVKAATAFLPEGTISPDTSNLIAAAIVTTVINAVKQYAWPANKTS